MITDRTCIFVFCKIFVALINDAAKISAIQMKNCASVVMFSKKIMKI